MQCLLAHVKFTCVRDSGIGPGDSHYKDSLMNAAGNVRARRGRQIYHLILLVVFLIQMLLTFGGRYNRYF